MKRYTEVAIVVSPMGGMDEGVVSYAKIVAKVPAKFKDGTSLSKKELKAMVKEAALVAQGRIEILLARRARLQERYERSLP